MDISLLKNIEHTVCLWGIDIILKGKFLQYIQPAVTLNRDRKNRKCNKSDEFF